MKNFTAWIITAVFTTASTCVTASKGLKTLMQNSRSQSVDSHLSDSAREMKCLGLIITAEILDLQNMCTARKISGKLQCKKI
jgi:hypothetical protein